MSNSSKLRHVYEAACSAPAEGRPDPILPSLVCAGGLSSGPKINTALSSLKQRIRRGFCTTRSVASGSDAVGWDSRNLMHPRLREGSAVETTSPHNYEFYCDTAATSERQPFSRHRLRT